MVKGILALALLGVLTAGDAVATSGANLGATPVNGTPARAVQAGPALAVEPAAAPSPASAVTGHATDLGSSTPQPPGRPASVNPVAPIPALPAGGQMCPPAHLAIACKAP
jgi:hypothetical protein